MKWDEIYDREAPVLFSWLLSRGLSRDQAEEVIQDVFAAALNAKATPQKVRAYLFTSARRAMTQYFKNVHQTHVIPEPVVEQEKLVDSEAINHSLNALPVEQREVVMLKVWHDMSLSEIAETLEISKNTVAGRWRYALEKMRGNLSEEERRS